MGFLRQACAGLATSGCTLELVFVLLAVQWNRGSNELPSAIYQRVAFVHTEDKHSVPHPSLYRIQSVLFVVDCPEERGYVLRVAISKIKA
jgi:hypothetical protein